MFRSVIVFVVLACVAAFAPSTTRSTSSSLSMSSEFSKSVPFLKKPANLDAFPAGNQEFDPFGFSTTYDVKWMREAELKHCRVAMLAVTGWLVQQAGFHLPGDAYTVSNPIDAFFHVGPSVWGQIFIGIGAMESLNHDGKLGMTDMHVDSNKEVGMFSAPIYGANQLKGKSEAQILDLKTKELLNGRLAMFAIGGLVHHTIIGGTETFGEFPNLNLWGDAGGSWLLKGGIF